MDPELSQKTVAAYGTWSSPISAEMVARAGIRLTMPWMENGVVWWLEGRATEGGRVALVRRDPSGDVADAVPAGFNVRSSVHEYGGGAYCIHDGVAFCSRFEDQRLYRVDAGAEPVPITPEVERRRHRYADGRVTPDGALWIGVRERHAESDRSADVVNELVAIPTDGSSEPRVMVGGRDFYSTPRISPDGTRLSFLAWDLPWMPWDGCELHVADLASDGSVGGVEHVAGVDGSESIWQPDWSPGGDLVFASDRSGWWNLERIRAGRRSELHTAAAEFGYPAWSFGARSFAFLGDGRIVCAYETGGFTHFAVLDPETGELDELDLGLDSLSGSLCAEGMRAVIVAGSTTSPSAVVLVDVASRMTETLRSSAEVSLPAKSFSVPRSIEFPTEGGLTAHALFYPPANPDFEAPDGERPPLIVESHGGPTGSASPIFSLATQFWTSRGFAVVDVDYGGSTGYGRAYRERLNGQWGVVDLQDCVNAAHYLVEEDEVDPDRLVITGGSAGGYTDDLRAHLHRRLRRRDDVLRHRRSRAVRRRRDAQVRAAVRAHPHRSLPRARRSLQGTQPDPLHGSHHDTDARAPGRRRPGRAAVAGRAHRRGAAGARDPACVPALRRARGTASGRRRTSSARSRPSFPSMLRSSGSSRPARSALLRSNTSTADPEMSQLETASSIARAMQSFVIEGGRPLSGTVRASGNKNGALPILAACVLASEEVRLSNVPRIRDVETMVELLADLGADVEWTGPNEVRIDPQDLTRTDLDAELAREIRASFLLAGPLLARFGRVTVPPPGGDVIGRRRLDTHVHAFAALGADVAHRRRLRARVRRASRHAHVPRRGLGHGHGERDHGRRARRGRDGAGQRRL